MNKKAGTSKVGLFCGARSIAIVLLIVFFAVNAGSILGSTRDSTRGSTRDKGSEPEKKAADAGKAAAGDKASPDANSADSKTAAGAKSNATATTPTADEQLLQLNEKVRKLEELVQQQQRMIDAIQGTRSVTPDGHSTAVSAATSAAPGASIAPAAAGSPSTASAANNSAAQGGGEAPLQLHIGSATITPVGFADFIGVFRSTNQGSGIGTNYGSIPFGNSIQGHLTEFRWSPQNSRIGLRVDADVKGAHVIGYVESDFLGFVPTNAPVSTNSFSNRMRLYWVDLRKDKWEILGGQSWSMLTPNRKGISPLPGDIFFTQNIDANYQLGLFWARQAGFRFVYHPSETVAFGIAAEAPEQYIGGSGGEGVVTLPTAFVTPYTNLLDNGNTTLNVPNLHPDIVAKLAFDPKVSGHDLHIEFGGVARTFKVYNPLNNARPTATGGGGTFGLNFEVVKNFRFITNLYYNDGGGRYIFGEAPDLIIRGDGAPSLIHSASTVTGFEANATKQLLLFGYYGGLYVQKNVAIDPANGKPVGYGFAGSPNSHNRTVQEGTFGLNYTIWRDAKYGALQFATQYSYLQRRPWAVATGQPESTHTSIIFLDLRYVLPGSAPKIAPPGK